MKRIKEQSFMSCVVYYKNNEEELRAFLDNVLPILSDNFVNYEIIFVKDSPKDAISEIVKQHLNSLDIKKPVVSIVNMSYYHGVEHAMNAAKDLAIGDFVLEMDTIVIDYDLDLIMQAFELSKSGHDIVVVAPEGKAKISSKIFYKIFNSFSKTPHSIDTETFRILSRRVINRVEGNNNNIVYRKVAYSACGLKYIVLHYQQKEIQRKYDKQARGTRKSLAVNALLLYTNIAFRLCSIATIAMMFITLGVGIYTISVFFLQRPVEGWTTTMLFLSLSFFMIFAVFTFIVRYLALITEKMFVNNNYIIESVEKLN